MKPELEIMLELSGLREIPSSFIQQYSCDLTELDLCGMNNLVSLPSSICKFKDLVKLSVLECSKCQSLLEEICDAENLEYLDTSCTLISRPPSSIARLNKLKLLTFAKEKSKDRCPWILRLIRLQEAYTAARISTSITYNKYRLGRNDWIDNVLFQNISSSTYGKKFGVRLLSKDESGLCNGIRRSRYEHHEEASCSSSKKQRSSSMGDVHISSKINDKISVQISCKDIEC
ncbi:hypothetical protein H5410_001535 [Solanum commersonii]|uniref:Uncharacterized protein n=1 Tax=Solanum commersonii TaxID=4109 RepID=A0A9J6AZW2_SOLCO|nr:hypothetical protein H5410_001535 [Solanum commersonii]